MDVPPQRIEIVHAGELATARRIALAFTVQRPTSPWAALIPFKFVFDAIGRQREIAWARGRYLPPRAEALHVAAARLAAPGGRSGADDDAPAPDDAYAALVERLARHYTPLLATEGKSYPELVKAAYPNPSDLEQEWRELGEIEAAVDAAAVERTGGEAERAERLAAWRRAATDQRRRLVEEIYYG